jgi:hypothetical protein
MNSSIRRYSCIALLALVCGCAAQFSATRSEVPGLKLTGAPLYIYSFFDVSDKSIGPATVVEINRQLTTALQAAGVPNKVMTYKETESGRDYISVDAPVDLDYGDAVRKNVAVERSFAPKYRMRIVPKRVWKALTVPYNPMSQTKRYFSVEWQIHEVATDKLVWSSTSHVDYTTWLTNDEFPQGRAKGTVSGIMDELARSGLL